jgi:hypothetical protein
MSEILTKTQELRHFGKTLEALENLVAAPESKDLLSELSELQIGATEQCNQFLFLTNEGLVELTNSFKQKFDPSIALVKKYNLTAEALEDLLARLKA